MQNMILKRSGCKSCKWVKSLPNRLRQGRNNLGFEVLESTIYLYDFIEKTLNV